MFQRLLPAPLLIGALALLLLGPSAPVAEAQIPQRVGFQGYLTDGQGAPLADGPWSITFRIYDVASGGGALWTQTESLTVTGGVFNALLGSVTPLTLPFDQTYWVGVDVDGQGELSPRTELGAAPYAYTAAGLAADSVPVSVAGLTRAVFEADGDLSLRMADGTETVRLRSQNSSGSEGGRFELSNDAGQLTVVAEGDGANDSAELTVGNDLGQPSVLIQARQSSVEGARVTLRNDSNTTTIDLDAEDGNGGGLIQVRDGTGQTTVRIVGRDAGGLGRVVTDVVEITGGADLSEQFDVAGPDVRAGMVVSIDPSRPGGLAVSRSAYDRRVAGVISGAGGVRPGMVMGQAGSIADGEHPVALTGRVWVRADATGGVISPGDLLTTSATPGHAMRADDASRAPGATLGKAMTSLESGRGLVLVLVNLQ